MLFLPQILQVLINYSNAAMDHNPTGSKDCLYIAKLVYVILSSGDLELPSLCSIYCVTTERTNSLPDLGPLMHMNVAAVSFSAWMCDV